MHRPNAVTYHELISGLLKTNKEIHRTSMVLGFRVRGLGFGV